MTAALARSIQRSQFDLIRHSATRLIDDTRVQPLRPPVRTAPATATIAECIAAKRERRAN